MKNEDKPAHPVPKDEKFAEFMQGIYGGSNYGLTKLEAFVMHNMPKIDEPLWIGKKGFDIRPTAEERRRIDKTIEACRYALQKLEESNE